MMKRLFNFVLVISLCAFLAVPSAFADAETAGVADLTGATTAPTTSQSQGSEAGNALAPQATQASPTISPAAATFDKQNPADVRLDVTLNGNTFLQVVNNVDNHVLADVECWNYLHETSPNLRIAKEYLGTLDVGTFTFTVVFDKAVDPTLVDPTVTVVVKDGPEATVISDVTATSDPSKAAFLLADESGNPIANAAATITTRGMTFPRTTDAYGVFKLQINLPSGTYDIAAAFAGNDDYAAATFTGKMMVARDGTGATYLDIQKYSVSQGDITVNKQSRGGGTITTNGTADLCGGVSVDGEATTESDRSITSGSTVVAFTADYIDTLAVGTHTVVVAYRDGYAQTTLTVVDEPVAGGTDAKAGLAKTGDAALPFAVAGVVLASGAAVALALAAKKRNAR